MADTYLIDGATYRVLGRILRIGAGSARVCIAGVGRTDLLRRLSTQLILIAVWVRAIAASLPCGVTAVADSCPEKQT